MNAVERFVTEMLLLFVACMLLIVCMHRVANAAEPMPHCAALLSMLSTDGCMERGSCEVDFSRGDDLIEACNEVERTAVELGADPAIMVVTAYRESRFDRLAIGAAGEVGMMQVIPRYWCKTHGWAGRHARSGFLTMCDPVVAGVAGLQWLIGEHGPTLGVAVYKAGPRALTHGWGYSGAASRVGLAWEVRNKVQRAQRVVRQTVVATIFRSW